MEDQKYEVAFKSRMSVLSIPLPWAPLLKKWRSEGVYDSRTEAEDSVKKEYSRFALRRELKKYLTTLLTFEVIPQWGAEETIKWNAYNTGKMCYHYFYLKIKPVNKK